MLAAQKGLTWVQLLAMNLSVFAGSAQFVMVEMWVPPLPVAEMILAVLIINMRYLLIGASLHPLFEGKSLAHKAGIMHLVADENWAVTMAAYPRGGAGTGFLVGGGICQCSVWSMGTLLGHQLGALVTQPERFALDFAFVAGKKRHCPMDNGGGAGRDGRTVAARKVVYRHRRYRRSTGPGRPGNVFSQGKKTHALIESIPARPRQGGNQMSALSPADLSIIPAIAGPPWPPPCAPGKPETSCWPWLWAWGWWLPADWCFKVRWSLYFQPKRF